MLRDQIKRWVPIGLGLLLATAMALPLGEKRIEREELLRPGLVAYRPFVRPASHQPVKTIRGEYLNDKFSTAPVEWRMAGAVKAGVANRWQCDPRWSFFALENDRAHGKAAAMWSKRRFPGDVSLEFFFGLKMEHARGNPFSYARDVNVTIGSDGSDLRKGYTFCFGGFENTRSCIMRNGVVVKELPVKIPRSMDYTRHWFRVSVERNASEVSFRVDHFFANQDRAESSLVYNDPEPLTGDRVAIWTYDNAIMLSRVTLSGETRGDLESPDFVPGPLLTYYEQ